MNRGEGVVIRFGQLDVEELRHNVISRISLALIVVGSMGCWAILPGPSFSWQAFLIFALLLLCGAMAYHWRVSRPRVTRVLLVLGPALSLALALRMISSLIVPYLTTLSVIIASAISPTTALSAALLNSVLLLAFLPLDNASAPLIMLWLALGLQWLSSQALYTALGWAWSSQQQATKLLLELRERHGELNRTLAALTEATRRLERTSHELAIARAAAEEARHIKAQFAANVSHELRTPLNLIMGFSELMYRSPEVYGKVRWTPQLRADIREIYTSSQHLMGMIDDILDLSRIEAQKLPLRLEPTDLGALIREAAATASGLLRGKDVALNVSLPNTLPEVLVDRTRIRQVLLNLLNNAIRFTDHGHIDVAAQLGDGEITVSVADTGIGIPEDQMEVIFEEFGQAKGPITSGRGGTGLGLAICRQFVYLHGGRIQADSRVGQGSVFKFSLPLPESGRVWSQLVYYAPEGWTPSVPENPLGKTVVLLAPASETANAVARSVPGYRVIPLNALDGLVEVIEAEHPAGIVLLNDPLQPHALDPESVWQVVDRRDLPILRVEMPLEELVPRILGVSDYLVKPIQREELVVAIRRACPEAKSILIVDDDPGFVALVSRILAADFGGLRARSAYSGEEALAILAIECFDVILLDLIMPGVNGFKVLEAIHQNERLAETRLLVTTGSSYAEDVAKLYPVRVELLRQGNASYAIVGRCLKALLDEVPPDYSRAAPLARPQATAAGIPAS